MSSAHNNPTFTFKGQYGDLKNTLGVFDNGKYMRRDTLSSAIHHGGTGTVTEHPTKSYLMQNRNLDFLVSGAWKITWEWDAGDFTDDQINDFVANHSLPSPWTTTKDLTNRTVIATCADSNYYLGNWTARPQSYVLKSAKAKLESTADGSVAFCTVILNDQFSNYTIEVRSIPANTTITIDKEGTTCYVIPFADLTNGSNTLNAFQTYQLTSASVDVANNSSGNVKVARIYK